MEAMRECCCGMDVHQATVVACVIKGPLDRKPKVQIKTFSTVTSSLKQLRDWLKEEECFEIAMESTGVYWKPVYNILANSCVVTLGNAAHMKNLPGRKTDMKDAQWIAEIHRCGLIQKSFIAPPLIQELRDLTRYRKKLIGHASSERNRIQSSLESANIKISTYMSDVFGVSGRRVLRALINGEVIEPSQLADLVKGKLRIKIPELTEALNGQVTKHHRDMINRSFTHLEYIENAIEDLEKQLTERIRPFQKELELLDTIPGVGSLVAASIIAEIGNDMSTFASAAHLSSWAGVSPGNYESAGKKKQQRTANNHKWIKSVLMEAAWATQQTRTFLGAKFWSLAGRKGKKKAIVAIAHKILVIAYYVLLTGEPYKEIGQDFLDKRRKVSKEDHYINYLKKHGYDIIVKPEVAKAG